ncbi:tetrahydrofolate synthase [Segatella salivae]|uniref:tetrahydrofolate synthase n=1 Tax=Segatella salivae TaxID=228604 RepID=UPI0028EE8F3C|nr:tetrahydrofolate synthase [Segatella salivae]
MSLILNHINSSNQPICCYKYPNTQRRRCSASIPMDAFGNKNALVTQRRRFYAHISMNIFGNINALMVQRRRCCAFDSPGLARNEPTPGKRSQGDSTPSVLSFL